MASSSARAVERALALLTAACQAGPITLSDAARTTELAISTALRLLRTLEAAGFVARDAEGRYGPGTLIVQLGAAAMSEQFLVRLCAPAMDDLAAATGESVYLSVRGHGSTAVYLAITEGTHSVRHVSWVGRTVRLDGSAAGAVLREEVPASGYVAVARGVEDDVTAICAPIRLRERTVAALSLLVPSYRVDGERTEDLGVRLARVTQDLSARLTGTPALARAPAPAPGGSEPDTAGAS
ncbi:MAG: helix-turn-helix domain-containing protein [Bifidobacteriaceae bacterium]|jgi:DNA-binding IclR family transcriptional regulator|nr:helix-turn-helix domain-containing protein [Bifidobacteriaceae bacterium]